MGYYTDFKIKVYQGYIDINELKELLIETSDYIGFEVAIDEIYISNVKWYEYQKDIEKISKKFPEAVIIVEGEGEQDNDIWRCYFKNGKSQFINAKIIFDDYDESKLE